MINIKGSKLRNKPVILALFMALWMGSTLFSLDVVLEQYYPHYDPNGNEVFWVGDDTILINFPDGYSSKILLLNIYTKKGKIIKLQPEVHDEKDYYTILAIDQEQQKFIFNYYVGKSPWNRIKNTYYKDAYYEYDVASGTMTELVTNIEAFKDFKKGETYFLDLRYYFKYKYDKNARLTSLVKWDRYTGNEEVVFVQKQKDDIFIYNVYDYDRFRNVLLAKGEIYRSYLVHYDGTTCGEPIETTYTAYSSNRLVWGKYILGFGKISAGPFISSVALWSSTTKQPQEIPDLYSLEDNNKTKLFAVNHRTNQIAVVGFYDRKKFESGLYIYRVLADGEINDDRVRYRSGPSTSAEILGMFNKHDKVKVIELSKEKAVIDGQEHYWYKVRLQDGRDVWVYGAYLTIME